MQTFRGLYVIFIAVIIGRAKTSPDNQTNSLKPTLTYNVTTYENNSEDYLHTEDEFYNATEYPNEYSIGLSNAGDKNPMFSPIIYVYEADVNISLKCNEEFKLGKDLPSVFDLARYNNTCDSKPAQRACFINQNNTADLEAELCRQYRNIVHLAYVFSCEENVPGDQLINASKEYIKKLTTFLQTHRHLGECYTQSIIDVHKMVQVVKMTDIHAAEALRVYHLPHSPAGSFQLVVREIPIRYKEQKIYIMEMNKYLLQSISLTNYIKENNVTNIFPYLYDILLQIIQRTEESFREDLFTWGTLDSLFEKYNAFTKGYMIFDIAILGSAAILFFFGIVLNIILLVVFVRFKEMRTHGNAMLINLVATDCISLLFNLLIYYVIDRFFPLQIGCVVLGIIIAIRHISYVVSIYSLVIISFQRYQATSQPSDSTTCKLGDKTTTIFMISGVWVLGMIYSLSHIVFVEYSDEICIFKEESYGTLLLVQFCILCVLPLILITIFHVIVSCKLKRSIKTMPGEMMSIKMQVKQRTVSSNILLALVFLSIMSYVPKNVAYCVFYYTGGGETLSLDHPPGVPEYVSAVTYNLFHLNSCFNPLVLYFLSRKFRKYFNKIICRHQAQQTDAI